MERIYGICFVCQDYKINVGHVTSLCPKVTCIKCGQNGHFRIDCKNDETEVGQESKAVDFSIADGEASVFKPDNFIKVKNMKSLLKMKSDNQAINDGFSLSEENALQISGIIPQNNEHKQFTFEEESNCETEPLDKLKRQLAEVFERKSNKTIEDLKAQLTASQWVVSEMKTKKNEEIRMIKSDERERYDYLLKVKSAKSHLILDEREKYDSLLKSECERHNKITQNLETKLRVSVGNLRNENESLIEETKALNSKIEYLERCVLLEANQSKELRNKLVRTEALKEKYEKECVLKDSRIYELNGSWIKETNSLNKKIENLEKCILLEANQSKELYNKLVRIEGLKDKYEKECVLKDSRIDELNGGLNKETNSLNTKIENLERCVLLEANQSKELRNKLVRTEALKEKYEKECSLKESRIGDFKESWIIETNTLNMKIENLERCILLGANQSKELCNKLVNSEGLKEKYEKECLLKDSRVENLKEKWLRETNSFKMKIENLERCVSLEANKSKELYNKLVEAKELKEKYEKDCSVKNSRIEELKEIWSKDTNSLYTMIENLEKYVLLEANESKELNNKLVEAEGLKEKYENECSIKDSRIKELKKMYKEESSIKDSRIEKLEKMYKEECSIKDSRIEELEKLYEKECADHEITESLKDDYIDDIQGLYIEINEYQLQLVKNPNEGHTGNGTVVSATNNGNGNMDVTMGNASVAAQKPKQAKKMPDSPTQRHPVQLLNKLRGGDVTFTMVKLKSCGVTSNNIFTLGCKIDGTQYTGEGPNKKDAKKHCAMEALKILYKIQYPGTLTANALAASTTAAAMPAN